MDTYEAHPNWSPQKEEHLKEMQTEFVRLSRIKYMDGDKEHGGRLWEKPNMVGNAKEEIVDLWHYICTLERQIEELKNQLGISQLDKL